MYWAVREDGGYEVIDGQQRTISICQYVEGDFAFKGRYFHNLQSDEKEQILDYPLMVYLCSGTDSEKLEWFKTINIAGEKLTEPGAAERRLRGSMGLGRQALLQQERVPCLRHRQRLHDRHAHPSGLLGDRDQVDQ